MYTSLLTATWRNQINVAIKELNEGTMNQTQFLEEARNMQRLHHRKIVQLMGVCTKSKPVCIIMEFMELGSLKAFLRTNGPETIGFAALIDMAAQVLKFSTYNSCYIFKTMTIREHCKMY